MTYTDKKDIMKRLQEHIDEADVKDEMFGIFLQGSQNYSKELRDEQSDVDTKLICLPSFERFCLSKEHISRTIILENEEHVDVKDLRNYVHLFKKMNINILEILFTEYKIINPKYQDLFDELIEQREKIARYNEVRLVKSIKGMSYEKRKALTHPYPSLIEKIKKYGFDGKQLSHILRLNVFLKNYIDGMSFKDCLVSNDGEYLRKVKRNEIYTLDEAIKLADTTLKETSKIADAFEPEAIDKDVELFFDDFIVRAFKTHFCME